MGSSGGHILEYNDATKIPRQKKNQTKPTKQTKNAKQTQKPKHTQTQTKPNKKLKHTHTHTKSIPRISGVLIA